MSNELKPCPFCGGMPEFPSGDGTQYELECDCGMAKSCVQISGLMDAEERANDDFIDYRYKEEFVIRAKTECIKRWNERHSIDSEQEQRDNLERHNEKVKLRGEQLTAAYRAGYNKSPLSIHYTDDEISEYNQGQGDRQREREA